MLTSFRNRLETLKLTPVSLLGMTFLFVIIFTWLYAYAPLLLGIRGLDEAMFIIGRSSGTFFSPAAIGESFLNFLPGVILCAVYSFFFLDVRKFLPLLAMVLAVPDFLTGMTTLGISNIRFAEFNSLFVVSQFLALSFPFLLFERYSFGKYRSWKEYFVSRADFPARLAVMKKSALDLAKQLAVVLLLAVIGYLPFILTEGFSLGFLGVYFIETGVVFFFSFYIVAGFIILFADKKADSKNLFITIFLFLAGMIPVILMIPLVIGVVLSPVFSLFGGGALRAAVAYAPGTTYLVSFYFLHLFLYSGVGGLTSLMLFLSSIFYVSAASLREFDVPKPAVSKPVAVVMILVIAIFAWMFFPSTQSTDAARLTADEVFRVELPSDAVRKAGALFMDGNDIAVFDRLTHSVVFFNRKSGQSEARVRLLGQEGKYFRNTVFTRVEMLKSGKELILCAIKNDVKLKTEYGVFYRLDRDSESAMPVAEEELEKKSSLALVMPQEKDVIALFQSGKELSAFSVTGGRWMWKISMPGAGFTSRLEASGGMIFRTVEDRNLSFHMTSMNTEMTGGELSLGKLMIFVPSEGVYALYDANGKPVKSGQNVCDSGTGFCPGGADSILGRYYSNREAGGKKQELGHKLRKGFLLGDGRLYCSDGKTLYALDPGDGVVVWKNSLADSKRYRNRFYHHPGGILHIKDYDYKDIVTAMVIDGKTGSIIGRWSLRGYDLNDIAFDDDGTCVLALSPADPSGTELILGLKFREP